MDNFKKLISVFTAVLLISGCASYDPAIFDQDPYLKSIDKTGLSNRELKEIQIGNEIHREILSSFSVYTEPKANEYVKEITDVLAKVSNRSELPYQCTILYSDKIYATSAPGGHVYITTGFINILDNESELAGVIAHEVAEVQYRNPKYSSAKKAIQAAETAAGMSAGFFGPYGMLAFLGIAALNYMTDEKDINQKVEMADKKALHYMTEAGYDPQSYIDVQYKILYADSSWMPFLVDYYNTRPINAVRMNKVHKVFQHLDLQNKTFDTRRDKFLNIMSGVKELYLNGSR